MVKQSNFYMISLIGMSFILTSPFIHADAASPVFSMSIGLGNTCLINSNRQLKCFGENSLGNLGTGVANNLGDEPNEMGANLPYINIGSGLFVDSVSCGGWHICVILGDSVGAKCWGYNQQGQLGIGSTDYSIGDSASEMGNNLPVINLGNVALPIQVAAGSAHTCFGFDNELVKCIGNNEYGQLGLGDKVNRGGSLSDMGNTLQFVNLGTGVTISQIHSSGTSNHNCVVLSGPISLVDTLKCWGYNLYSQLGYGSGAHRGDDSGEMGDSLPTVDLGAESRVKKVSLGFGFTCVINFLDEVKCWGSNGSGQLGIGSTTSPISSMGSSLQTTVVDSGSKKAVLISTGNDHTCILLDDLITFKCIGMNTDGQLGQEDTTNRGDSLITTTNLIPAIDLGTGSLQIKYIGSGSNFNCVAFVDRRLKCFGSGASGVLGSGSFFKIGDAAGEMGSALAFVEVFAPTKAPTKAPTNPTSQPTKSPTKVPSKTPTKAPSKNPTKAPTNAPSKAPTKVPTKSPTYAPTLLPSESPSISPSAAPIHVPSKAPTIAPTFHPSKAPTSSPTFRPKSKSPSKSPGGAPTEKDDESSSIKMATSYIFVILIIISMEILVFA